MEEGDEVFQSQLPGTSGQWETTHQLQKKSVSQRGLHSGLCPRSVSRRGERRHREKHVPWKLHLGTVSEGSEVCLTNPDFEQFQLQNAVVFERLGLCHVLVIFLQTAKTEITRREARGSFAERSTNNNQLSRPRRAPRRRFIPRLAFLRPAVIYLFSVLPFFFFFGQALLIIPSRPPLLHLTNRACVRRGWRGQKNSPARRGTALRLCPAKLPACRNSPGSEEPSAFLSRPVPSAAPRPQQRCPPAAAAAKSRRLSRRARPGRSSQPPAPGGQGRPGLSCKCKGTLHHIASHHVISYLPSYHVIRVLNKIPMCIYVYALICRTICFLLSVNGLKRKCGTNISDLIKFN
ncbi:uncharacterized protein LOC112997072 [Dromaius novaehollandiae]|uniref:uncharacterized protein LOC112997072 n=1 Tax=Dromaius novaehollandiae TaxID=8790 RepID=UPI00311ED2DE